MSKGCFDVQCSSNPSFNHTSTSGIIVSAIEYVRYHISLTSYDIWQIRIPEMVLNTYL